MFSKNPERNTAIIWFIISIGALVLALLFASFFLIGHFTFGRFFPVMLLPCLTFVGLIISIALYHNSGKLDAILSGKDLLLHWTYQPEEIETYAAKEHKRRNTVRYISLATCIFILLVALLFTYDKNGIDYGAILEIAILFLIIVIFLVKILPAMGYGQSGVTEFYLAQNGALFVGTFHVWRVFGAHLESINFKEGKPATLEIVYSVCTENGSRNISLCIPVPEKREKEALNATKKLAGR